MITIEDVRAAQDNDMAALTRISEYIDGAVTRMASNVARSSGVGADADDLAQEGRIAVWQALPKFRGDTVDEFVSFAYRTAKRAMLVTRQEENAPGLPEYAATVFSAMLTRTHGDHELARELAQTLPPKGQRLSKEAAWSAYAAFNTEVVPEGSTYDNDPGGWARLEWLYAAHGVPADLVTASDITKEAQRERAAIVHAVLNSMTDLMNEVLRGTYGIERPEIADIDELADALGLDRASVRRARSKGHASFAKRYIGVVATSEAHAAQLTADAAAHRARRNEGDK